MEETLITDVKIHHDYSFHHYSEKCIDIEYHVHINADVSHKEFKMYYDTNQSPTLSFCGAHTKPHGARGLSSHYNLRFDTKIGNGICEIFHIPYACIACR